MDRYFIGSDNGNQVVFTWRNTTESINLVAQAWGRANVQAGDEILLTEAEHHANFVPWWQLAQEKGAVLKVAALDAEGLIDLASVKAAAGPRTTQVFALRLGQQRAERQSARRRRSWPPWPRPMAPWWSWTPPKPPPTSPCTPRTSAPISSPSAPTRCSAPPAWASSGARKRSSTPCRPGRAAAPA